jgi:hypothetical protein
MRSNKTSCGVMLNLFSSWLVNASTQSDSNVMQIIIYSSIHTRCRRFNRTSWSRRQHPISSPRCVNTVISCSINTLLRRSIWSQMSTRHLLKHIETINVFTKKSSFAEGWSLLKVCFPKFDWVLWHYNDFVSWNIDHWVRFFCVMLGKGQIS